MASKFLCIFAFSGYGKFILRIISMAINKNPNMAIHSVLFSIFETSDMNIIATTESDAINVDLLLSSFFILLLL